MADTNTITLPDVGDFADIEIIELLIAVGDEVEAEQSIIVLESDKATMEIPSPAAGKVESILVKVGDRLNQGDKIATLSGAAGNTAAPAPAEKPVADEKETAKPAAEAPVVEQAPAADSGKSAAAAESVPRSDAMPGKPLRPHPGAGGGDAADASATVVHASPSIRRYARELGVDL